jgi:hypothetical protein
VDVVSKPFVIKRVSILTNVSRGVLDGRVEFPPWSLKGLSYLEFRTFRLNEPTLLTALPDFDAAIAFKNDNNHRLEAIASAESRLITEASLIGNVRWDERAGDALGKVIGDESAKIYIAAPTPRIDKVPGGIKPGESILAIIEAKVQMSEADVSPIVALYSYLTERAIIDVNIIGGSELCELGSDVEVAAPNGSTVLGSDNVRRGTRYISAQATDLKKATKLVVPVKWKSESCRLI